MLLAVAAAQQTPPPPPSSANAIQKRTPGLAPELQDASRLIGEGAYGPALSEIDAVLAADPKNPQARFLKGVVQTDQDETDAAIATFQGLNEDYPELPEPYNNLAVIWAKKGEYAKARTALEIALATRPDYVIAHENLGDIYVRLAGLEYDHVAALDKKNKSAPAKLVLVRELFAVTPTNAAPKPEATPPAPAASAPRPETTQPAPAASAPEPETTQPAPAASAQ